MHTGHNQELPKCGNDDEGEDGDDAAGVTETEHKVADHAAQDGANRSQSAQRNGNHDGHGAHGYKHRREHVGNDLLHELLDDHEYRHGQNHGEHRGGIVVQLGRQHAVDHGGRYARIRCSVDHRHELRSNEHTAEHHAERLAAAKLLRSSPTQINGKEVITGVVNPVVEEVVDVGIGRPNAEHAVTANHGDSTEHGSTHDNGDRHDHGFGQVVEGLTARSLERQRLLGAAIEVLVNGAFALNSQRNGGVVDLRYVLTDDDLILAARPLGTQYALDLLNFIVIGDGLILKVQTQTGHAVRRVRYIGGAADGSKHVLGNLLVIDSHVESLLFQLKARGVSQRQDARFCSRLRSTRCPLARDLITCDSRVDRHEKSPAHNRQRPNGGLDRIGSASRSCAVSNTQHTASICGRCVLRDSDCRRTVANSPRTVTTTEIKRQRPYLFKLAGATRFTCMIR